MAGASRACARRPPAGTVVRRFVKSGGVHDRCRRCSAEERADGSPPLRPPCLLYGPGDGGNPHRMDEFYKLADLRKVILLYAAVIQRWCGTAG